MFNVKVQCGRCGENMTYSKYKTKHRLTHYNLCWLEGEEIIVSILIFRSVYEVDFLSQLTTQLNLLNPYLIIFYFVFLICMTIIYLNY